MSLQSNDINDLNRNKIVESVSVPVQPGGVVLNPDGTNITSEKVPTDSTKLNPSLILSYDGTGNLTTITKTINSVQYRKSLTYDGTGNLTDVSVWVQI